MIITRRKHKPTFEEHTFCKREPKGAAHKVTWGDVPNTLVATPLFIKLWVMFAMHVRGPTPLVLIPGCAAIRMNAWVRRNQQEWQKEQHGKAKVENKWDIHWPCTFAAIRMNA